MSEGVRGLRKGQVMSGDVTVCDSLSDTDRLEYRSWYTLE
jgi:hypothetical protein